MIFFLWVALALANLSLAKVSTKFNDCRDQFFSRIPPQGFERLSKKYNVLIPICQMYEDFNNPFFASLYHNQYRYGLYSAYILDRRPGEASGSSQTFRLEPQVSSKDQLTIKLVNTRLPNEVMLQPATETAIRNLSLSGVPSDLIRQVQAVNSDYSGSGYHKGHLNPNADHADGPGQKATYTLTNVAPMNGSLNSGQWSTNERRVRDIAATCGKMYVITGVVPGNNWINVNGVKRVNIPSHVWSAFCCLDNNNRPMRAEGALAPNDANVVTSGLSISKLESHLESLLGVSHIRLFHKNCT